MSSLAGGNDHENCNAARPYEIACPNCETWFNGNERTCPTCLYVVADDEDVLARGGRLDAVARVLFAVPKGQG